MKKKIKYIFFQKCETNSGDVFQAKYNTDQRLYAIKFIKAPDNSKDLEHMQREVDIMSSINYRYIVRYTTSWKQLVNFSELYEYIDDEESTSSSDADSNSQLIQFMKY